MDRAGGFGPPGRGFKSFRARYQIFFHKKVIMVPSETILVEKEADEILAIPNKNLIDSADGRTVDFYFKRGKDEYYVDIKTSGPNLSGFISMRKNNLKWIARADKKIHPILALPYNPYAPKPYKKVGSDRMELGKDLLVGKDFWDLAGGSDGCYEDIEESFRKIGYDPFYKILAKVGIK